MASMALTWPGRTCLRTFTTARQVRFYSAPAERSIPAAKRKYVPTSGTYPKGFLAGSAHAGVKASNTKYDDVALVVSEKACPAQAVFTRNLFQAAPCLHSKSILRYGGAGTIRGVVVNSGCANAVTGTKGREDAFAMAEAVDKCFEKNDVKHGTRTLVMSTGVIGQQLPISKITNAIPKAHASLGSSHEDWMRAAQAICTTDTFPKLITRTFTLPSHPDTEYSIAGMTKGAGMIHPNMGTLLAIVCTDAKVEPTGMRDLLRSGTKFSFNRITIDGDTSTNDTVAFLANGAAAPAETAAITFPKPDANHPAYQDSQVFVRVFKDFMLDLAKLVVRDGEGATKFVTVRVQSDISQAVCRAVAYSIAKSSLVKTALYGKDANWGRILCAIGYTPYMTGDPHLRPANMRPPNDKRQTGGVDLQRTTVMFIPSDGSEPLMLLSRGEPEDVDESRAKEILEMEDLEIFVKLDDDGTHPPYEMPGHGQSPIRRWKTEESVIYTCDLSHEYVTINGDYRT